MRKLHLLLVGIILLSYQVSAQVKRITGKVTDASGSPVSNASIIIKGTNSGTVSGIDGSYTLGVGSSATALIVSAISLDSVEVQIGNSSTINITLTNQNKNLEEVIVTGYSKEKKSQFAGAASRISGKFVETVPVGSFDQAMQGRAPGLLVNSSSGQPGSSPTLTIRGVQSVTGAGSQPLFIVDGVPIPAGDMQTINPNDFESLTILKDASAAALYGARGALGVVVITTKRGKAGTTNVTYRTQWGVTQAPNATSFDMMNTSEILQYEEKTKLAGTPGWNYSKKNPAYEASTPAQQARFDFLLDSLSKIDTDYGDLLFRQGLSQNHEINISGGNDKSRFYLSGGYFDQKGTDLNSQLTRYTTRLNLDHTSDKFSVSWNTSLGYSITNLSEGEFLGNSARNSFQMSWRAKPYENPYRADGSLIYGASSTLNLKQIGNVLEGIENSKWRQNQIKINSGVTLAYKILPSLVIKNVTGIDVSDNRYQRYIDPASYVGSLSTFNAGINSEAYGVFASLVNTTSLTYNKKFNEIHDFEIGGYFEGLRQWNKSLGFTLYNLDPRIDETGQGAGSLPTGGATVYPQNATSAKSGYGIRSYFANARYTYDNKYTLTGNIRRDGTSRILNEDNQEITTFSLGAIWNATLENFFKNQNILTDLRVRASYGSVPNIGSIQTSNYAGGGGLVNVPNYLGPQLPTFVTTTGYPGSSVTGLIPSTPGNPELQIETVQKFNAGVEFGVWQNRVRATFDAYYNKTIDLFVNRRLGANSGFGGNSLPINAGSMRNQGAEFTLSVDVVRSKLVEFSLGINHAINSNKITDLGGVPEYTSGTFQIKEGVAYGTHYTYHYLGADPATGRPMYEKPDGSVGYTLGEAGRFAKFGTYLPKHVGGFTADLRVGKFTVSALFSYQFDVVRSNNTENWVTRGTPGYHTSVNASRRLLTEQWEKPGDQKFYQSYIYDRDFTSSDLQDAKFLRFRNLNVAYQIPSIGIKGMNVIKSARVYAQLQNIAVWSPWRGPDPEDGNNISLNEFPNPRIFVAGIDINF
jgi:TonB-linked SusC/RagA family outer membrane protein